MGLDVMIALVTLMVTIIGAAVTLGVVGSRQTGRLRDDFETLRGEMVTMRKDLRGEMATMRDELRGEMATMRDELRGEMATMRDELRGAIKGVRTELGGRFEGVAEELTRTRLAVARMEGSVFGIALPDTGGDVASR